MRVIVWAVAILAGAGIHCRAYSQPTLRPFSDPKLTEAMIRYEQGEYEEAHERLALYINQRLASPAWKNVPVDDSWITALKAYAECCLEFEDYRGAIVTYDNLERLDASDASIASSRGFCYEQLGEWLPAIDNYRLAHAREPDDISHRVILAKTLVTAPHVSLRDGREASELLAEVEKGLPNNPTIWEVQAAVAAETGEFDRAVELQSMIISVVTEADVKQKAARLRNLYQTKTRYPFVTEELEPLSELERTQAISAGTVIVRVRGRAMYDINDRSACVPRVIDYQHAGLVLNDRGDFLIPNSSLAIPYSIDPTWESLDGAQWIEGPFIEVYSSTPSPEGVISLGRAEVKAKDDATGLALIRLMEHPTEDIQKKLIPIRLEQSFDSTGGDSIDEMTTIHLHVWSPREQENHTQPMTEDMPFGEIRFRPTLHKAEVQDVLFMTTYNRWNEPHSQRVARWISVKASELTIGSPVINQAGECVAMIDEVVTDAGLEKTGIPAEVISRVAAKLLSFGKVERAKVPVNVYSTLYEEFSDEVDDTPQVAVLSVSGMQIYEVPGDEAKEREWMAMIITHVDDIATPDNATWEVALERAARLRSKSLTCTVFDVTRNETKSIEIPIHERN